MTKNSLTRRIIVYMSLLIALLLCVLSAYTVSSYTILAREVMREIESVLQVYGGTLKSRVTQIDSVMNDLLMQNRVALQLLKSTNESRRFYASQDIHNYLVNLRQTDTGVNGFVVADAAYGVCVDAAVSWLDYWDRTAMRAYATACAEDAIKDNGWRFERLNGREYLCRRSAYDGRAAVLLTAASDLLRTVPDADFQNYTFLLTDGGGSIRDGLGDGFDSATPGARADELAGGGAQMARYELVPGVATLVGLTGGPVLWDHSRIMMAVVAAVIVGTLAVGLLIVRYVRKEMVQPMNRMTGDMRRIDGGEYTIRVQGEYGTREFTQLKDTFNRLMDEIVHMRIAAYEKRIVLQDMELKSIRLQIRPHFFLNAITTLSSLSGQGKTQQIKTYVDALSKNIRYMFRSGLHTVPIVEELRHIENYFDMQECKYPNCIFHFVELPQALEAWQVPQMLVQTFIENEYKYAVSLDGMLTILIHVSEEIYKGESMLLIRIEDDGKGYPEDVLAYMNGDAPRPADDGERVGLWSVKRMMALMYERDDLLRLENIKPHGCLNLIRVPAAPKHQLDPDGGWPPDIAKG